MKILLVKAFPKLTSVGLLAQQLKKSGHEVHLLVPTEHGDCEMMKALGMTVHVFDFTTPGRGRIRWIGRSLRILAKFIALLRAGDFDIIHLNLGQARTYGRLASLFVPKPIVISSVRGLECKGEGWGNRLDRATVAVSRPVKDFLVAAGVRKDKIEVIRNGVDLEAMDKVPEDRFYLHRELGLAPPIRLIGMVAFFRGHVSKGHKFFFEAARSLAPQYDDIAFVLVGRNIYFTGYTMEYFDAYAKEAGFRDKVHFLGERADIPEIFSSLYVNVLPSLREGCPMVVLESMARSRPNVASRIDSVTEILEDGVNGLLFEPGNSTALAEAIKRLLDSPETADALGKAGRRRVEEAYSAHEMGERYETLYRRLLDAKSVRGRNPSPVELRSR